MEIAAQSTSVLEAVYFLRLQKNWKIPEEQKD